jgi:hypothetical protein
MGLGAGKEAPSSTGIRHVCCPIVVNELPHPFVIKLTRQEGTLPAFQLSSIVRWLKSALNKQEGRPCNPGLLL